MNPVPMCWAIGIATALRLQMTLERTIASLLRGRMGRLAVIVFQIGLRERSAGYCKRFSGLSA